MKTTGTLLIGWILCAIIAGGCADETNSSREDQSSDVDASDGDTDTESKTDSETETESESESESDTDTGAPWNTRFDAFAEALKDDLANSDALGISAAVLENGEVVFAEAFGFKDAAETETLTPDTLMQIGSTTKQMTAVLLLQKVADGSLSLDDTLDAALPGFEFILDETWDDEVTVRHLLSQQSGIFDWTPWSGPADDSELIDYTFGEFADEVYLMNPPGAFFNYSNPNYVLAGLLAETEDTRAYPDLMTETIFAPLGMDRTFLRKSEVEEDGDYSLSFGFTNDNTSNDSQGEVSMDEMQDFAWVRPAGLAWTTPTQMMRWADFMMNGDESVLSDALRKEMETSHGTIYPDVDMSGYGYGLFVDRGFIAENGLWYETPILQHGGNTLSFTHELYMLPEYDFAVSICSSAYGDDLSHSVLTALTTLVDLPAGSAPPIGLPDPDLFDRHVGEYLDPWLSGRMIITREGDDLRIAMPDLTAAGLTVEPELTAATSRIFFATIDDERYDLAFISETPDGPSMYVRNRLLVAERVETASTTTTARRLPAVSPSALKHPLPVPRLIRALAEQHAFQ